MVVMGFSFEKFFAMRSTLTWGRDLSIEIIAFFVSSWRSVVALSRSIEARRLQQAGKTVPTV
jgi:hypothetical protein